MSERRNADRLIATYFTEPAPQLPDRVFDAVRSDIHRTRQRMAVWPWRSFEERPSGRVVGLAAAVLALVGLLILNLAGFGPGGGRPSPTANVFRSPFYGYSIPLPSGWTATPATVRWDGQSAPSLGPNVDLLSGPHLIVLGYAGPFAGDLAAFTRAQIAANARDHADTCAPNALQSNVPISLGGRSGALLTWNCGALVEQEITTYGGAAYAFTIRDAGFLPTLDQMDLASVRSMLESMTFPTTPITSP
jgi:hypothetical protein